VVLVSGNHVPHGGQVDGHAAQSGTGGDQWRRLDQHGVERGSVPDEGTSARRNGGGRRRSHEPPVQVQDRPGLLARNRGSFRIQGRQGMPLLLLLLLLLLLHLLLLCGVVGLEGRHGGYGALVRVGMWSEGNSSGSADRISDIGYRISNIGLADAYR